MAGMQLRFTSSLVEYTAIRITLPTLALPGARWRHLYSALEVNFKHPARPNLTVPLNSQRGVKRTISQNVADFPAKNADASIVELCPCRVFSQWPDTMVRNHKVDEAAR